jgi:hypothetical protein
MQVMAKRIVAAVFIAFLLGVSHSWAQEVEIENIPDEILQMVRLGTFAQSYRLDASVNPFYLRGDLDGDGKADYALRIKAKASDASGIAIWLSSLHKLIILGAGVPFKVNDSVVSNLDFLNTWQVYGKRQVERGGAPSPPPRLIGEAIWVGKRESASGLIYWNGRLFAWYQQGD